MASRALVARLAITASNCARSICTGQTLGDSDISMAMFSPSVRVSSRTMAPITSLMSARSGCSGWRRAKASRRRVRSAPRSADSSASRTSSSVTGSSGANLAQHVEIADDDRQQVVEVVRQSAGKLADRLHLLRLAQLLALLLRLAPFGQVADDADEGVVAACGDSPTASSIGKVEPSLRRPMTSRPMPMIFGTPVAR